MRLSKCPYCEGIVYSDYEAVDNMYILHFVKCNNCGSRTGGFKKKEATEILWNTAKRTKNDL